MVGGVVMWLVKVGRRANLLVWVPEIWRRRPESVDPHELQTAPRTGGRDQFDTARKINKKILKKLKLVHVNFILFKEISGNCAVPFTPELPTEWLRACSNIKLIGWHSPLQS